MGLISVTNIADGTVIDANDVNSPINTIVNEINGNLSEANMANTFKQYVLSAVYPVGSIYFNATDSNNPSTYLGFGTWVAWGSGRVPVGVDTAQTEFNTIEKTGGAKTHTLTIAEMPSHSHRQKVVANSGNPVDTRCDFVSDTNGVEYDQGVYSYPEGGGGAHNNLQPYITVYMWKRTA